MRIRVVVWRGLADFDPRHVAIVAHVGRHLLAIAGFPLDGIAEVCH